MLYLDHLLYAVPDLQQGIDYIEALTGVRAVFGGRHTSLGTHNALLSLGDDTYLEIIAADPSQTFKPEEVAFGVGKVVSPTLITWAVRTDDFENFSPTVAISATQPGFRIKEDGSTIKWRTAEFTDLNDDTGIVPFIIEWQGEAHPARTTPRGCEIAEISADHPFPDQFTGLQDCFAFPFAIRQQPVFHLNAKIRTPKGMIDLT